MQPPTPPYTPTYSPLFDASFSPAEEKSPLEEGEIELSDLEKVKKAVAGGPEKIKVFLEQDDFPLSHGEIVYQLFENKETSGFKVAQHISDRSTRMALDLLI